MKKYKLFLVVITVTFFFTGCDKEFVNESIKTEEAIEIVEKIMPHYSEIDLIFNGYIDTEQEVMLDENKKSYMEVKSEKYKTLNDIKDILYSTYTTDYIEKNIVRFFNYDYPSFKEMNGKLYVAVMSGAIKPIADNSIEKIELFNKDSFSAIIRFMEKENQITKHTFYFKKTNDNWLIDDIDTMKDH